ncbi:RmlC-like cupin domain-containing protein [Tribonema minus]|uniref:RmlC-like cupin domain-containing protein n=1 Tax=Tribonema minus TaxID=303371 RepID=A0A836CL04_9STRA|nr:RmlC-like cupin domain-containing protein [Tribonema minus]
MSPISKPMTLAAIALALGAQGTSAGSPLPKKYRQLTDEASLSFALPTRATFRAQFTDNTDFKFDLDGSKATTGNGGGSAQTLSAAQLPSLTEEKVAMVKLVLEPCGINLPHVHPRATEILYVVDAAAEGVLTAFVEENGGRTIENTIVTGEAAFFPQGLTHVQVNMGCTPATMIAALGSDDFGVQTITTTALKGLAGADGLGEGLAAALGISQDQLAVLIGGFPDGPAIGAAECRQRCGLP